MKTKPLDTVLLIFKILIPLCVIIPFAYLTYLNIDDHLLVVEQIKLYGEAPMNDGMGEIFRAIFIVLVNFCLCIISGICLFISHRFKNSQKRKQHIKHFTWIFHSPIAATVLFVLIMIILLSMRSVS